MMYEILETDKMRKCLVVLLFLPLIGLAYPTVESLSISGPIRLGQGGDAYYKCTAYYSDGTSEEVSPTWSIVSGTEYATIDSASGKLEVERFYTPSCVMTLDVIVKAHYRGVSSTMVVGVQSSELRVAALAISGFGSVTGGYSAKYTCTARYTDGTTMKVSPDWYVMSGSSFESSIATIDSSTGVLLTKQVESAQTISIHAYFGGITESTSVTITPPASPPFSLSIEGPLMLRSGSSATYLCMRHEYEYAPREVRAEWSIVSGSEYAFIDSDTGTVHSNSATQPQWVTICANYGGVKHLLRIGLMPDGGDVCYCVIDLSAGPSAMRYPVTYLNAEPKDGWTSEYKSSKLVLGRMAPGTFMMGDLAGGWGGGSAAHQVTLTQVCYMGVFEVTQKQWELVMGSNPSVSDCKGDLRPVEGVSYDMIRGDRNGAAWPKSSAVDPDSFVGVLRQKTGLNLDLPTEAQWEFACRAGASSDFNNGGSAEADLKLLGRYRGNCDLNKGSDTAKVGSYRQNVFGFYDMHGNVAEWCLDFWDNAAAESSVDPKGCESGAERVLRGGGWHSFPNMCTAWARSSGNASLKYSGVGLRLACTLADDVQTVSVIHYDANGGDCSITQQGFSSEDCVFALPVATRSGYVLDGWYTLSEGGDKVESPVGLMGDVTLHAHWKQCLYCVIDLSAGPDALKYPVDYVDVLPADMWTDEFKTTKLVLQYIYPGCFRNQSQCNVMLTKPFLLGVFEVTQKQWELVMGSNPSYYMGSMRPIESVSYEMIRGGLAGAAWPNNSDVDTDSFVGRIRQKTGLHLDLPTEAQWEYACRAGTTSDFNNGGASEDDLVQIGRCSANRREGEGGYADAHTNVGSYLPNAWGLYDMHGNVSERCLDWFDEGEGVAAMIDPVGPLTGTYRAVRGGNWNDRSAACTAFWRNGYVPEADGRYEGFRLAGSAEGVIPYGQYAVSFDACGGELIPPRPYECGTRIGDLPVPTRDGYKFVGWYTDTQGGELITVDTVVNEAFTCYARWLKQYTIRFFANDGTDAKEEQVFAYGDIVTLSRNKFVRGGYTFCGWAASADGAADYADGQMLTMGEMPMMQDNFVFSFYAVWQKNGESPVAPPEDPIVPQSEEGLYCVIDLSGGTGATSYPVTYLNAEPIGGWSDEYKTTKLVLRRIEAGAFKMQNRYEVWLTKPFYIGVFEVTQRQWELVMGSNPSQYMGDARPVERVSYDMIRGDLQGASWPCSIIIDDNSFVGKIQKCTGLNFDLPTEAQWECACCAGTKSDYNDGGSLEADLRAVGRYSGNCDDGNGGYSEAHTKVGSYLPNAWGLYDMHGNVDEWCLDWYGNIGTGVDPQGVSSGSCRVNRGGCYATSSYWCTSFARNYFPSANSDRCRGFRLARTILRADSVTTNTITYVNLQGAANTNVTEFTTNDLPLVLGPVGREGWRFLGWTPNGGVIPAETVTNVTFTANWEESVEPPVEPPEGPIVEPMVTNTITYLNLQGAANTNVTEFTTNDLPLVLGPVEREGCAFLGWTPNGGVIPVGTMTNVTFTANWGCDDSAKWLTEDAGDGAVIITRMTSPPLGHLEIPAFIGGRRVVGIGSYAFSYYGELTSATIPEGVTSIGYAAFRSCTSLTSIVIPSSVMRIGGNVVDGTKLLKDNSDGLVVVDNCLIKYKGTCPGKVVIPEGVRLIAGSAFYGCKGLTEVVMPNGVTSIGDEAFEHCSGLTTVVVPSSVTNIGWQAFYGCRGLMRVDINDLSAWCGIKFDSDDGGYGNPLAYAEHFYLNGEEIDDLVVPDGVMRIESYAFSHCRGLTSVTIPPSVTSIGMLVFSGCDKLQMIYVSSGDAQRIRSLLIDSATDVNALRFVEVDPLAPTNYTVAFDANGGSRSTSSKQYARGSTLGTLPMAMREGYEFLGWFTAAVGGSQVTAATVVTKNMTLYAHWTKSGGGTDPAIECNIKAEYRTKADVGVVPVKVVNVKEAVKITVKGLPSGLKFTAKDIVDKKTKKVTVPANSIYGTPTKSGVYVATVTVTPTNKKSKMAALVKTLMFVVRNAGEHIVRADCDAAQGTVKGMGVYAPGKKVTLKATAVKGWVFSGWRSVGESADSTDLASWSFTMPNKDVKVLARFVTVAEDKGSIGATVDGFAFGSAAESGGSTVSRDVVVKQGMYVEWPVAASALSATTVKVSGLPSGLKFTAKDVMKKGSKTEVEIPANTIYGTPKTASKVDKNGKSTPSKVKITVTTAGKAKQEYVLNVTVRGIPAEGTFNGGSANGLVTLTVAKTGKISGKYLADGKTWTLSAAGFDTWDDNDRMTATLTAKSGKEVQTVALVYEDGRVASLPAPVAEDRDGTVSFEAWRNGWKTEPQKSLAATLKGQKVTVGEDGNIVLTIGASGAVTAKGTFGTYSASCSTVLIPTESKGTYVVYLYFPPKAGKFAGWTGIAELVWDGYFLQIR